ncbi:MAG: sulfite exporter TauE/SafE family protein [Pseudomonadota bacterium]
METLETLLDNLVLLAVSLAANLLSALAGGGAGLLQLPALIFLGLPFGVALATHKIASVALGVGATLRHTRQNTLEWRFTLFILACGLPGVVLGSSVILAVPETPARIALGLMTIAMGLYSWRNPELGQEHAPRRRDLGGHIIGAAVLFVIGILNGSLTSGTGLLVTLWLVRWFGLDYKRAVAYTLVLVGLFWNGAGALTLGLLGEIRWDWLPALLLGSLIGGYLGAHLSIIKGNRFIKRIFEFVTIATGLALIAATFG